MTIEILIAIFLLMFIKVVFISYWKIAKKMHQQERNYIVLRELVLEVHKEEFRQLHITLLDMNQALTSIRGAADKMKHKKTPITVEVKNEANTIV